MLGAISDNTPPALPIFCLDNSLNILSKSGGAFISDLEKISGGETRDYLDLLKVLNVIEISDSKVRLIRSIDNIGPTLEW